MYKFYVLNDCISFGGYHKEVRDDELEHLDMAVEHGAKGAEGYGVLHNLILGGCKVAVYVSERI